MAENQQHLLPQTDALGDREVSQNIDIANNNHGTTATQMDDADRPSFLNADQQTTHKVEDTRYSVYEFIGVNDSGSQTSQKWKSTVILTWWLMEISGLALSISALVAIVIVLKIHDGQPLPNWPNHVSQFVLGFIRLHREWSNEPTCR